MQLNKDKIHYYQKNRGDFLMIDYVTELEIGNFANGYKDLDENLWFFKIHWPGDPNMPASSIRVFNSIMCVVNFNYG